MEEKVQEQMAKMVDAVQPHCDEPVIAAVAASHAGSMSAVLFSKLLDGAGATIRSSDLPNPVFIVVGANTIRAFDYLSASHVRPGADGLLGVPNDDTLNGGFGTLTGARDYAAEQGSRSTS